MTRLQIKVVWLDLNYVVSLVVFCVLISITDHAYDFAIKESPL